MRSLTILVALVFVAACTPREELIAKDPVVPAGVDLSGQWQLQARGDTDERIVDAQRRAAGSEALIVPEARRGMLQEEGRRDEGTSVHVFLETGRSLKITQTGTGLFVSFDRARVEEYRFGEKRIAKVGPIVADRVSGWEGSAYLIETLDEEGAKLIETYRLSPDGQQLIRTIRIVSEGTTEFDIEQVFDRR